MLQPCPQYRFGFSSNCIVCWDHALNAFAEEFRGLLIPIVLISFFFGLKLKRANLSASVAGLACLTGIFYVYYILTARNETNWVYHLENHVRNPETIRCAVSDIAVRVRERVGFIAEGAWKSWALFASVPFALGLLVNVSVKSRKRTKR